MNKIRLAVLFGGVSSEYEVSLLSAQSILENLDTQKYDIYRVGITKDGRWRLLTGKIPCLSESNWESDENSVPVLLSPDRSIHGLVILDKEGPRTVSLDAIFPVLHGKNGEDGTVQGLFELAGIPYVGCGVLASAGCMDKEFTHTVLSQHGIPGAKWICIHEAEKLPLSSVITRLKEAGLDFPLFVKPANAGSSVGITKAHNEQELSAALVTAFHEDCKAIIEETIDGIEVECAVMGNDAPFASDAIGEIEPLRELYDYEGKYCDDTTALHIPARVPQEASERVRSLAVQAYRAMGCRGLARVDFFIRRSNGEVILNELNTLPGFTSISMYPKLFIHSSMSYSGLLDRLIAFALEG